MTILKKYTNLFFYQNKFNNPKFKFINLNSNYSLEKKQLSEYILNSTDEYCKKKSIEKTKNSNLDNITSKNNKYKFILNFISVIPLSFFFFYNK